MWVYFIECEGGSIYTGIAKDVAERYDKHVKGKGAIYTKLNPPVRFLAAKEFQDDTEARKLEWRLKRLSREKKMQMVEEFRKDGIRSLEGSSGKP